MNIKYLIPLLFPLFSCSAQENEIETDTNELVNSSNSNKDSIAVVDFYQENKGNQEPSKSKGSVSNGTLLNGKLLPFYGTNFQYFDANSYLASRAFTSHTVRDIIIDAYAKLHQEIPSRYFYLMELSSEKGGKLYPHKTHQNGLSADFMMPKLKDGRDYYGLDTLGVKHYLLKFNDNGEYEKDTNVKIDFNVIAKHLLILEDTAKKYGYKISKVIIKIELKDELFATEYGEKLKSSGIYIVQGLTPLINGLHDEHYHVDFEQL
jgi:penicillin-insensitive murein endopeptidase